MKRKVKVKTGKVFLVGAGPGDPGLLTVRGRELLEKAEAVVYDWLVHADVLALARNALKIDMGKKAGEHRKGSTRREQESINRELVRQAKRGLRVVRLKGGDPFVFGRGAEEAEYLFRYGIPFEIVPGVSAGSAVPAYAGVPVTDRRKASLVVFVTGHENPDKRQPAVDWEKLAALDGTLVSFMGVKNLHRITRELIAGGRSARTPVTVIEWGTLPRQRVAEGTLATIADCAEKTGIRSPALAVIGEVNAFRRNLSWYEKKPLYGKTVLITRSRTQAGALKKALEEEGARVFEYHAIRILPPSNWKPVDRALAAAGSYDWIVFTSTNGVDHIFGRMDELGLDARVFGRSKIAAIGTATADSLRARGIKADLVPPSYHSESLVKAFRKIKPAGGRFLLLRTDIAPDFLRLELTRQGASVAEVCAYRTRPNPAGAKELRRLLASEKIDFVTFTSSSTVDAFFKAARFPSGRSRPRWVSIGPVTSKALRCQGFRPWTEASEHTIPGLVRALVSRV